MNLAAVALAYAARGIPVVPVHTPTLRPGGGVGCSCSRPRCKDQGKHPRTARGLHDATTDPDQVRAWWRRWPNASIGARTGTAFDVCDIDTPQAAQDLRERLAGWTPGPVAITGHGWHLLTLPTGHGNRLGMLPGVDWRGQGGYVVLPPSLHPSGRCYRWLRDLDHQIPDAPAFLRDLLAPSPPEGSGSASYLPPATPTRRDAWAHAALQREADAVAAARPPDERTGHRGERAHTLNRAAFKLGQLIEAGLLEETAVHAALTDAAARCGPGRTEAARVIRCGLVAGQRHPRHPGARS